MEPETRQSDSPNLLRLDDARFGAEAATLQFGGGLAGVLTAAADRSDVARRIVSTVMGPPAEADSSIALAGRAVPAGSPSLLLPPSGPAVLDRAALSAYWHAVCARRRDDLAAQHASHRLERHRIDAALDRARTREVGSVVPSERATPVNSLLASLDAYGAARPQIRGVQLHAQVRSLLHAIDSEASMPSPEAMALADAWDAHTALVHARAADPAVSLAGAEERVRIARMAAAMSPGRVPNETRAAIDLCHRAVVEAEAQLFEARRRSRRQAVAHYEAAVAAENVALSEAGVDSYASLLMTMAGGDRGFDAEARRVAERELDAASEALEAARHAGEMSARDVQTRAIALRAQAERLLGHAVVGGDPPAELRALRVSAPGRADRVRLLAEVLQAAGVPVRDDVVVAARELLASDSAQPAAAVNHGADASERSVDSREAEWLEQQRAQQGDALTDLDAEITRLDSIHEADVSAIDADDVVRVMESLLDAYRAGNRLGGRLPVVLDGALDGVSLEARDAALLVLARAKDVQSIVVTDNLPMMNSVTDAGGTIVLWPDTEARTNRWSES